MRDADFYLEVLADPLILWITNKASNSIRYFFEFYSRPPFSIDEAIL